jgi:hypothetical protein
MRTALTVEAEQRYSGPHGERLCPRGVAHSSEEHRRLVLHSGDPVLVPTDDPTINGPIASNQTEENACEAK